MMKNKALKALAAIALTSVYSANASTINVLWYTGGVEANFGGQYVAELNALVAQEENPLFNTASVNTWNLTTWASGPMPAGSYNVLVAPSAIGGWLSNPDYTDLINATTDMSFSWGNRKFLTAQDADWHYINGPGSANFDGPAGFLIDAINWAGSGSGLGAVFLNTGLEGFLFNGVSNDGGSDNGVTIPGAYAAFPVNEDLSTPGLSGWNTSSHDTFSIDPTLWTQINVGTHNGDAVTIVSAEEASGGTGGVPEPTTVFGGMALAGLVASRVLRRKKA